MLPGYHIPLPQGTEQKDRREDEVYQIVWYQDDTENDDDEAYQHQWRIDAEGVLDLVIIHTQQDGYQDDTNQPGILHQQLACHHHEVLGNRHAHDA